MNLNIHAHAIRSKNVTTLHGRGSHPLIKLLIMKLIILLTIGFSLHVSANALGQRISLSVKEASFKNVLQSIQRQSGYSFLIRNDQMQQARPVTLDIQSKEITEVLPVLFSSQPFSYEVDGQLIKVVPKSLSNPKSAEQQQITIRGRVSDSLDNPLVGVTVQVKESGWQTITDREGRYEIEGVYPTETLHFRLLSYEPYETPANRPEINVTLRLLYSKLQEVDVSLNTGYQNIPKERATGSFVQIDNEMLNRRVSTDVVSRLEGITNGLAFYRSSASEQPTLNIRGRSTIFANTTPLIILDNFPFDGDINNINPNDIESITVLKDAAAASIWGVRAGNGVIVINTKRGRSNQPPKIEFNTNVTIGAKPDSFYLPRMSSADFIELETEFFNRGYYTSQINSNLRPALTPVQEILIAERGELISEAEAKAQIEVLKQYDVRNDLQKYFFRNSVNQQYALNVSGGGNNSSYFLSLGYDDNSSNAIRNGHKRYSINANNNFSPVRNLDISTAVMFIVTQTDNNNIGISELTGATKKYYNYAQLADANGNPLSISYGFRETYKNEMEQNGFLNWQYRPLEDLMLSDNQSQQFYNRVNLGTRYVIFNGLSGEIKYQFEKSNTKRYNHLAQDMYFTRDLINVYYNPGGVQRYPVPLGDIMDNTYSELTGHSARGQFNYNKDLGQHSLNVVAGIEVREIKNENSSQRLYGYDPQTLTSQPVNYETLYRVNPNSANRLIPYPRNVRKLIDRFISYYANGAYSWLDRYTVSASGRLDQSNLFGVRTNQRNVPLWSTGLKWDTKKEDFFDVSWMDALSFRATYGFNGNLDKSTTALLTGSYATATTTTAQSINLLNLPNPQLRWEKSAMFNVGLDFEFKGSIVTGSIEYFQKKGTDLIGTSSEIDPTTGFQNFRGNLANMRGRGVDIKITTKNINRTLGWTSDFLFSYAKDEVTKYNAITATANTYLLSSAGNFSNTISPLPGYPVQSIYSLRWGGLDPENGNPLGYLNGELTDNFTNIFLRSTPEELIFNGPVNPTYFGGIRNNFSYKYVAVSFNITYKFGHYFRRPSVEYARFLTGWVNNSDYASRWQNPGDEQRTQIPSIPQSAPNLYRDYYFYGNSEVLVEKADHIRLQDVSLSYTLVKQKWPALPFRSLQAYIYANNLGILWRANNYNIDPESIPDGAMNFLPMPINVAFGIKATF